MPQAKNCSAVCLLLFLAVATASAYNPNQPQGFGLERSFQQTTVIPDQVDLFSGRLSVALSVGPFSLVYNNNVWRYSEVIENNQARIKAEPDRLQNAGLGWHLGWGELYDPGHWYNGSPAHHWLYVGADGTRHTFYGGLHRLEEDGDLDTYYTRDGSYLRLKKIVPGSTWHIEFPDGATRRFVKGGPGVPYRLVSGWDRFGSAADPDFTITYSADDKLRTFTDRHGRNHYVHLAGGKDIVDGSPLSWMTRVVTRVDLQGVGGQRAVYDFKYRNILVNVSCKNNSTQIGSRIRLPHLVRIDQPDGTAYTMEEGGAPSYVNRCPAGIDDAPGSLTRLELPSGGVMRWTYQEYEFPPGQNWGAFNSSAGVATREAVDIDGTVLGSWNYVTRDFGGTSTTDPEVWTDVVALPEGDCTRHYFSAIHYVSPSQQKGWEYGLPFVRSVTNGTKFLSSEVYPGHHPSSMLCSGAELQTTYLRFRHDPLPGVATDPDNPTCQGATSCSRLDEWYNTNRTLDASRTVFHDDGGRWVDTEFREFDGIGNFRQVVTTGNQWSGSSNNEQREIFTNYTRAPGTFPGPSYNPPSPSDPWILRVFDRIDTIETEATGQTHSRVEMVFDDATGALQCTRTLRSGLHRTRQDSIVTFGYDSRGNVTDVKSYGSDRSPLPSTTGAHCGVLPSMPAYWTKNEYEYDELARSRPYLANGSPGAFLTFDVDIDPWSGTPIASRDSAGFEVSYSFDDAGRITAINPQGEAPTNVTYTNAFAGSGARVRVTTALGGTVYLEAEQRLDSFGRVKKERRTLPNGTWVEREMAYNARGWILSQSEWDSQGLKTQYLDHDPFGRPTKIRPPEGSYHDVLLGYIGARRVTRSAPVKTNLKGPEVYVTRTREFDRHGRLRKVLEPAGESGSNVTTTYVYDVGGRLTRITTTDGSHQQVREFNYDNRGFLLSERHPEKGTWGNGLVSYSGFDAKGRFSRKIDGHVDLRYDYDYLGRLRSVKDASHGSRLLRSFTYDAATASNFGLGKLNTATAFNYLTVPATGEAFQVNITQQFLYHAVGGAVSQKVTTYDTPSEDFTVRTDFDYDAGRNLISTEYPRCVSANCASTAIGTSPTLQYRHQRGWLTSIPGWVHHIGYHPSGLWSQRARSNGVTDHLVLDDFRKGRIKRIYTSGTSRGGDWNSGVLTYDGSGNITRIGSDKYAYDKVDRLTAYQDWEAGSLWAEERYSYDGFGNLRTRTGTTSDLNLTTFPVDPATNRLTNATYDSVGNVLNWNRGIFSYDPFNRLVNQAWMAYAYDAFGERAASYAANSVAPYLHVRGLNNELLSTFYFDSVSDYSRVQDWIYADGNLVATLKDGQKEHYHMDHLGTQRLRTNSNGGISDQSALLPYGQEAWGQNTDNRVFTGHERDESMDTDYMHTRHYSSAMGRFLSVDSFRGLPSIPLSLNRYAYVMGNPVKRMDPDGRISIDLLHQFYEFGVIATSEIITVTGEDPARGSSNSTVSVSISPPSRPGSGSRGSVSGSAGGSGSSGGVANGGQGNNRPERDENGELDCSGQAMPILCETANDNSDEVKATDLDCGLLAFGAVSATGAAAILSIPALLRGAVYGVTTPATGYQSLIGNQAGVMAHLPNWSWTMQGGFFGGIWARGSMAGPAVQKFAGGTITRMENLFHGAGVAGGAMGNNLAIDAVDRAITAAWRQTGCGD